MIHCRKAEPADAELVAQMRLTVWKETYRGIFPDAMLDQYDVPATALRDARKIADPRHQVYLYFDGEECAGYFSFGPGNWGSYKGIPLALNNLYIRKAYQGQGLGSQAFAILRRYCAQRGIVQFCCGCNIHNSPAMTFYRHMGGIPGPWPAPHENKADDIVYFEFYTGVEA